MTWDPTQNWQAVLQDYYNRGFGPAADGIKEYWEMLEAARTRKVDDYPGESNGYIEVYNDTFFKQAYGLLDRAAKTASQSPDRKYLQRINFVRIGLDHTKLTTELRNRSIQWLRSDKKDKNLTDQLRAKWTEIEANCNQQPLAIY